MKMVSTHEMVVFLHSKALPSKDEAFIARLHSMDQLGAITELDDDGIDRLDTLYQTYKGMK